MYRFMREQGFDAYADLHAWSVARPAEFWSALAQFCGLQFHRPASRLLERPDAMPGARWFVGATLNYAEQLLRHPGDRTALVFRSEAGDRQALDFDELRARFRR